MVIYANEVNQQDLNLDTVSLNHSKDEKMALDLINLERKKNNLPNLSLIDNLTKISDLKVRELDNSKNIENFKSKNQSQDIQKIFKSYGIENCKSIFQYFGIRSGFVNEIVEGWLKDKDKRSQLLDPDATNFSFSCLEVGKVKKWYSFVISKIDNLDEKILNVYRQDVIDLVNEERKKYNLKPLKSFNVVMEASQIRAKEQIKAYGHKRPDGRSFATVLDDIGFKLGGEYSVGENVAKGQLTPEEVVEDWMNSKSHRANILNSNYKYIGVGAYFEKGEIGWAQIFYEGNVAAEK